MPDNEKYKQIADLTKYPEWSVFLEVLNDYMLNLAAVDNLDENSQVPIEIQALARKYARQMVREVFQTIGAMVVTGEKVEKNKVDSHE